jgi:RimJ/RimL family protein N-acetyltransferase
MQDRKDVPRIALEPWAETDLELLRLLNAPEMTEHLGGPETAEKILARHKRYVDIGGTGTGRMFRVVLLPDGASVGSVGYWEKEWQGETVYEIGWAVLPAFQGKGIASVATAAALAQARAERKHRYVHAYPSVDHPASNAVCRKVGFELLGVCDFEYPAGNPIRCNDWRFDLSAPV